ncbi:MAG TPA: hypothetical protein VF837_01740 [Patescibacteria group bacterium]
MTRGSKTIGLVSHALCAVIFLTFFSSKAFAITPISLPPISSVTPATGSATVTATVPEQSFNPPILLTPGNNNATNQPKIEFSWKRPSPLPATPLDHYDLYIDDSLFAQGLSDSLTTQDFYFYTVHRVDDIFFLDLKNNIAEGYHHWFVVAYNSTGLAEYSETWTFYVDSIPPHIKLISADNQILNWTSENPSTIPSVDHRYLYVSQNPLLTGDIEPYANLQFTLLCPYGVPSCTSLTQTFSYSSGHWQNRFYDLLPNKAYTVILSSTDSAGNSIIFPQFYLIFLSGPKGAFTPSPSVPVATPVPPSIPVTPSITLPTPTTVTLPPTLSEIFIPAEFLPVPPTAPALPPISAPTTKVPSLNLSLLLILIIIGLPLHLAMTEFGRAIDALDTVYFLAVLIFPFFFKKRHRSYPFTTITLYDPQNLVNPWQKIVTDINGYFSYKDNFPKRLLIKASSFNKDFKPVLENSEMLPISCLFLMPKGRENTLESLQHLSYGTRIIPLLIAIITSSIYLYYLPSYFPLIYLYLSLQTGFSEYLYPKITL